MDVNSRDPSQNIIPFRIKGVDVGRFDQGGNLGIGTVNPTATLEVNGTTNLISDVHIGKQNYNNTDATVTLNGHPIENKTTVVVNMDSQPVPSTALNRQKKQSIPLASASTLTTSDIVAKMSGVSVGKTHTYGVGPAQMASYGNIVVAVGEGTNSIAYSLVNPPTASSWVGIPNSSNTFTTRGRSIAYANGTWVAVGEGTNSIAYSTTTPPVASSWIGIPSGTFNGVTNIPTDVIRDVAYGNGVWVVSGTGGSNSIAYSLANPPTAESWVGISNANVPIAYGIGTTFGNGTWVTGAQSGGIGIVYSTRTPPTADSWISVPLLNTNDASLNNISTIAVLKIIYTNGVWLAAGNGTNALFYSVENPPIAGSWMPITTSVLFGTTCRSIAYGNGTWVACGESGSLFAYSTSRIPHSSSWVAMKGPTPSSSGEQIYNITFNVATNTWYFMGDIGSNCMFYSTATPPVPASWVGIQRSTSTFTTQAWGGIGITTSAFTSPINVARLNNKVTFPANRMLAVGGGGSEVLARSANTPTPATTGTISYSDDDGATWQMVPGGATNAMFSSQADIAAGTSFGVGGSRGANAVAWNGEKWVAAGNGRTNSLAFSDDGGMTWTGITGKSIFSVEARDVAWNGRMWVAVGRGIQFSTAYSYDGITWMGPIDASGVPINVFSFNIAGDAAATSDISGGGNHVIWTGKMWVATGTRTLIAGSSPAAYYTVAYSTDGKSWTGVPESGAVGTGFDMYAHGVAWNGRNYIATGRGTLNTLAFFTDVTSTVSGTWLGLGNTVFSVWGRGITWGAKRWMATGRGTNTVAYSTNGRNWQGCGANVFKPMRRFMAIGDTGLYTGVVSGQPQRGVAITYSDDGITWDAPMVNQNLEFIGGFSNNTIFINNILVTNTVTDNASQHTALMYSSDAGASWARLPGTSDTEANGGTGMTVTNNGAFTLVTNTTRTRCLVGGGDTASSTRKVYFSNDGFNWRNGVSSPNTTQMAWVAASLWVGGGYNRWLVGGNDATTNANGRIMYSGDADAVAAWLAASPATYTNTIIMCFAANADFSVILAGTLSGNVIYRSTNGGATWTTVNIATTPINTVRSIAFAPSLGRWVAVGGSSAANTIIYSTDATGNTWSTIPSQAKTSPTAIFKNGSEIARVIWDAVGGRFIVGGFSGSSISAATNISGLDSTNNNTGYTMAYSSDGIIWTPVTVRSDNATSSGLGASASMFGPFLTQCREIMALDGSGDFTPLNTGYSVSWNSYANRFIATGSGTTPVVYSNDGGVTWTPANQQQRQQAIVVAGGLGTAAGTSSTSASHIAYSIDGKTWSQGIGIKEVFGTGTVLSIKYGQTSTAISPNGRIWVAGGTTSGGTSCLAFSQNGIRWSAINNATTMITNVRTIVYAPAEQMNAVPGVNNSVNNALTTVTSGVGNGVWVAGGDTTNSLIFSYDGISWSEVPNSLTILSRCNACAFGNGLFVAGGLASSASNAVDITANMAYSTDGINWQPIRGTVGRLPSGVPVQSITYGRDETGRGLWVAGAGGSTTASIFYSYNGIDWIAVPSSGTNLSATINSIAYGVNTSTGQGLWVASVFRSSGYSFIYSTNGRDGWTSATNTKAALFDSGSGGSTGIAYLNGVWYATGLSSGISSGRTLAYSYDGISSWFGVYPTTNIYGSAMTIFSLTDMRCVATTADYAIPIGSSVGSTTSAGTATTSGVPSSLVPVRSLGWTAGIGSAYIQHPTLLFGSDNGQTGTVSTSISADGGQTWESSSVSIASSAFHGGTCNDAFWNGNIWTAVGYDSLTGAKVATSRDGVSWSQIPSQNIPIIGVLYSIMWNGTLWMIGGDGSPTDDVFTASIAWSTDLISWTGISNTDTKLTITKRIAWNGMYWVAVGYGDVSTIMHSRDTRGLIWEDTFLSSSSTNKTASIINVVNDVVWGGGRWVAVGRGSTISGGNGVSILYSADTPASGGTPAEYAISGRRWIGVAGSAQLFPYGANSISWNGKRFVATGPASASCSTGNIIAWSADGISWNAYSTSKTIAPGQRWVAVGSGSRACIALSADGRVWTDVSGSSLLFSDISGASATLVNTMKTGARAIGWNGNSLVVGGSRSATTVTATSQFTATSSIGRTTIPVCAFIGSGNGVMGGGSSNAPMDSTASSYLRTSSSVFVTHLDVNMREGSAPYANMWLNTYTDLSGTQLFQVTPEAHTFSSALKWNGWAWVANFGLTTNNPITGEQYGSIWYCTDPLARVGWSVASNYETPRILIGHGGYAALEWNGVAWLACGYDPNNNNLIYTTDKYGAIGWTAVSGIVSGAGSASFQPVCIASSSRFWVVGGSQGVTSAMYYTNDRTGATGWRLISTATSVLPGVRITSIGYNGTAWICCGGGGGGSGAAASRISWRADADDIGTGWAASTISGTNGGIPPVLSGSSAIAYNAGAASPIWVVVGDVSLNTTDQIAFTSTVNGSTEWKKPSGSFNLTNTTFGRLNGIAWTGYSWIATSGAGTSRIASTMDITASSQWNNSTNTIFSPTLCTNAIAYVNIPISLLTTGMPTTTGVGAGTGAMWRGGVGRTQGLLPAGGTETTSVVVRSANGAEGTTWSQVYSRNFLIAVGGGIIRDASGGGGTNRMAYSYDGGLSWITNNTSVMTTTSNFSIGSIRTVKYGNGMWVAGGDATNTPAGSNCLGWSRDGVNWFGAGGTQIFGTNGSCYSVCCNDRGRWVAVGGAALTTAGTYTNTSGAIYTMAWSDDGMNWMPILGSRALFGIVCQGVSYGADASGVGMWTAIGRGTSYTGCAYSYDGKNWFLSQTSFLLFGTSTNVSLTERYATLAFGDWRTVAMNSTGQIQFAGVNGGLMWRSMDYGVTWSSLTLQSRAWVSVAVSSTGQYVVAASSDGSVNRLFNSSDYGVTWVGRGYASNAWVQVAISATGQYQVGVATSLAIQMSRDYGVTWVSTNVNQTPLWTGVTISSSGQYITAVTNGNPRVSSDYGITFIDGNVNLVFISVAMSSTGQFQIAGVTNQQSQISNNYGVTWTQSTLTSQSVRFFAISSTGQYRDGITTSASDTIKRSNNYDTGWTANGPSTNYFAIAMSATGQYQTAVSQTSSGLIFISSNFGETWQSAANDSRSLGIAYGKDATGTGMWVATAGRRDRSVSTTSANTMAYSYDGKSWRGITAAAGLSEQAWSVAYGKDGFGVGMWVAAGYDAVCGLKWSYDGVTWNASTGASGASVWTGMTAGRRAISVYWNGTMWLASTSDVRNGEPRGTGIAANNASGIPGYLLYSYNGKNWLPVLAPNTYAATISSTAQPSIYSVLPNPVILDFGSFYDDQSQRGITIANTTARTVGPMISSVPIKNINTIVPYGKGSLTTGQVPYLLGGDSGLVDGSGVPPTTSEFASTTSSMSTSTDGGNTWRAVPNSTRIMTKVNKILCDESTQQIVAVGAGNYSVATSTPATAGNADGWTGVFGSRMTNTRAGMFERFGTNAAWFSGAKMWIASGRAQSRRGSSLAVSVNGTVWHDAKIISQTMAGTAGASRGGGLVTRTTKTTTPFTINSAVIPYTAPAIPLLTYTDSAVAFSTQVSSVAVNSQYNCAVVGGSSVQFVAGGRGANGGLAFSNGGQNWTAASTGTSAVFQTPTNVTRRTGSGGFDASFGTVALTQRLTVPTTYPTGTFVASAINETGQYHTALITNGQILISSDYGITWTTRDSSRDWIRIAMSSSGQYQTALVRNGQIYTSSDYGNTWTARADNRPWYGISISSTGQYQTAVAFTNNNIWTSTDYGVTWTSRASGREWYHVSVSSTGQYQTAVVRGGQIWISSDYGVSWSASESNRNWVSISISYTGQYQTAAVESNFLYYSSDFGMTWTARLTDISRNWTHGGMSMSATGQYQSAIVSSTSHNSFGFIYSSSDFGFTWTARMTDANRNWTTISLSGTGQVQLALEQNTIFTSTNYGVTWIRRTTDTRTNTFTRTKSSASGQYQLATSGPVGTSYGQFYVSSNYGETWIPRNGLSCWLGGAVSGNGMVMMGISTQITLPNAFYVRIGGTNWRDFVPLTTANSTTNLISWGPDLDIQFYDVNYAPVNEIAKQFSYFAGYWLNYNRAVNGQSFSVPTSSSSGSLGIFTFTATSSNPVLTYTGSLTGYNSTVYTLTPQLDGISAGKPIILTNVSAFSPIVYLDATNSSSYNRSTNTWTNLGLLTGTVNMQNMGTYDAYDNSGSFFFNGTSNFGTLTVTNQTLTQATYIAVVKREDKSGWSEILDLGDDNLFIGTNGNILYFFEPSTSSTYALLSNVWYSLAFTISTIGDLVFYVNGISVFSTRIRPISKSGTLFGIGAGVTSSTAGNEHWKGKISSLAVYNRALSAQEINIITTSNIDFNPFSLIRSTDYGNTFNDISGTTLTYPAYWRSISITNSASVQTAVAYGGGIYRSSDTGATWSNAGITIDGSANANTVTPRNWQDVAISAETGAVQVTCVSGGYLYVSSNTGATWNSSGIIIDGSSSQLANRSWQAVALSSNGQYGLACVNSGTSFGFLYRTINFGATWSSSDISINGVGTQTTSRTWQDVGMSANGKYQVACISTPNIFYSKDYGASWFILTAAGNRNWSSVAISKNGSTISATTNDASGGVWTYTMPDDQYYRPAILDNSGSNTTASTVRAVAYGNSGTGATLDGYWLAGADASANSLAYSTNGIDWTAVVGSKTTLFNSVNSVAYGVDTSGTPMWVAVGLPFVGSVPGMTAYSIAYSYNMTTWVGVLNNTNFTGQGNHVAFGQDEFGAGLWVAVGESDGVLSANLGDSALYNSNGNTNTTIFYSYDGANWAAATGAGVFTTSGTDVSWGVDASGVATWVATGVGYTTTLTGIFTSGGQVAHSTNGRVWTPIRTPTTISPALSAITLPATTRGSAIIAPPASTGFVTPTYSNIWRMLGGDIDGEAADDYSGTSVSISANGNIVAILAPFNDGSASNAGQVRVYSYNPNKTVEQMNQSLPGFGPVGWDRLGADIDGETANDQSLYFRTSVALSSDGTTVAIGANQNDGNGNNSGHVRVYRYTPSKTVAITNQTDASFGPVGWTRLGADIDGEAANDESGWSIGLSADGTVVAIGAWSNDGNGTDSGHVRVYKYTPSKTVAVTNQTDASFGPIGWTRLGADIDGEAIDDRSGTGIALSADGTTVAIGAHFNDGTSANTNDTRGHVRVYKYSATKTTAQTNQLLPNFGPIGWNRLGEDIDGDEYLYENYGPITLPTHNNILTFPVLNTISNWEVDISFTSTSGSNTIRGLVGSMRNSIDISFGWCISVSSTNGIQFSTTTNTYDISFNGSVSLNTPYNLNVTKVGNSYSLRLLNLSTQAILTNSFTSSDSLGLGPVSIGGWPGAPQETFTGTISYVKVLTYFQSNSGVSVSLSADGSIVGIGANYNDGNGTDSGHVRIYRYNSSKAIANSTGPVGWERLGGDIDGEATSDQSGLSVSLSADGTVVAIGAPYNDGTSGSDRGQTRVYRYNPSKTVAITNQSLSNFGPVGWDRIGTDIDGEASGDNSGYSVSLSADGTTLAIGAAYNDGAGNNAGQVRIYKLDTLNAITYTSSDPNVAEIYGNAILFIKEGVSGTTTITATQAATLPFTASPITVQGTLNVSGTTYTLQYNNIISTFTPFTGTGASALTVAYGRAGSQGTGAPLWIVGGSGGNVFARSSRPSATTTSTWTVDASNAATVPFPVCNSLIYSNGVWVAGNNTGATNLLARSTDGGATWTPVTTSSMSSILTGVSAIGTNSFCNYSLAYADYSNDTNLRSWVAVQGTKNFMFEGGVSTVATVSSNISATSYNGTGRAWWVAGGIGLDGVASIAYTTDPSGATAWTRSASASIANLVCVNDIAFSPFTQRWLAVGAGAAGSPGTNILVSDASGITWTSVAVAAAATPVITLNTCVWNQLDVAASSAGRWLAGGTRNNGGVNNVTITNSASIYMSTETTGATSPWTPITGTGAILSQVYSIAYNGRVWIAAGVPATDNGSTSTLMRTTDPSGATGWVGITATNTSVGGFDTSARSIAWNADQQIWIATGENTSTSGSGGAIDASFSSIIYSLDVSGGTGTWRSVRESNSMCFSGEGTGIAFTGSKWFLSGEGNNQIITTNTATAATASWSTVSHSTTLTRASDITYTGRRLIATGSGAGSTNGLILSSDNTGTSWSAGPSTGFSDVLGGGTSVTFEASYEGVGRLVATGRSATNTLSVSADGGSSWSAPTVQYSSSNTFDTTTQPLFTTGGNSAAYVGNDTLFATGGNDIHWTGKRWLAVGRNSAAVVAPASTVSESTTAVVDVINNNTTPVATSDDGITWQCVRTSQAPNLSECAFVATNSRIGSTPLIDSKIVISDGGDTETNMDYGGMSGGIGGSGTGVASIDIISELTPTSNAASSVLNGGTIGIIGAVGNGGINNIGHTPIASFDTTAFSITTRPVSM